ncbi:nicotinate-nucleotide pyrophosphorylase [Delftia acidovorans SPH-1]|jgi:nicotinate-nucleotide pyrophosphorylase (carboxylating)|uniref:nicotinate-nucleotide diphosphorylase (carboxylating) n=2 Tax=Delftia TaxID=80865 RepID=A0ABW5EQF4_9BURK|nr:MULTISPECIES: carboxylating nicotinate-nucleotide diphosphorylase [Delftia]MCP4017120.1 carboxylating nicotinate-nucleotide diphosphorylase [Delftia sp.]OLE93079.1 MAG: nicotinate-nucleotide diphosphorylase (carboxylating) [Delftia sp. 13_1_40CM_3_66_6]ABX34185.1 nicotinate-nucleotide pyrophosphorylase [Delftia acidovorans SPH-1]KLO61227.1 nicotinate-nucleotide pyrophosphorylase [Delftia tsuruhatensis]MBB1649949.1 nicotinate-nucleotide diphosphorylase (carboxylating) [Delftia sp. UME58]
MSINTANALSARLPVPPLPDLMLEPLVRSALLEDLGRAGDLTTDAIVPADAQAELRLVARQEGVLAGLDMARLAFRALDAQSRFEPVLRDGSELAPGQEIARIHGSARAILTAERVALNYLCHLSGVATATASIARAIADTGARVTCTRKTMPGLRALQKYAVRVGGGSNHRFGLDDAVLIKDNHIALAGGVAEALARARAGVGHMVQIQLEVDTLEQLEVALSLGVEVVLLDNMDLDTLRTAVSMARGRAVTEASGRITPETARAVAETGVDQIAVGWITHSARVLDIGLDT